MRDVSSISSLEGGSNPPDKIKNGKEIQGYPNNSNYPRKLNNKLKDKKLNANTKSIEEQKLTIRKDFLVDRQGQLNQK